MNQSSSPCLNFIKPAIKIRALVRRCGLLDKLSALGVEALDCFSVDNALVRPCDPVFVGHCIKQRSDCGTARTDELSLTLDEAHVKTICTCCADPVQLPDWDLLRCSPGARVVRKAYPEERVGVFAQHGDAVTVVEYRRALQP